MYVRTGRRIIRRRSSAQRGAANLYWVDAVVTNSAVIGVSTAFNLNVNTALQNDYQAHIKGATVLRIVGDITAYNSTAPAAGTDSTLVGAITGALDASTLIGRMDPTVTPGRMQRFLQQWNWHYPLIAASVDSVQTVCMDRHVDIRTKVKFRSNDEDLFVAFGITGGVNTWRIRYHFRVLLRVP